MWRCQPWSTSSFQRIDVGPSLAQGRLQVPQIVKQPPFQDIADQLMAGVIIPFLGAGASAYDDTIPNDQRPKTAAALAEEIAERAGIAHIHCDNCNHDTLDLAQLASYYKNCVARRTMLDRLLKRELCKETLRPTRLHRLLAKIAAKKPMLIITTNYDTLIEQAFDEYNEANGHLIKYDVVATSADILYYDDDDEESPEFAGAVRLRREGVGPFTPCSPDDVVPDLSTRSLLYKMHGSVGDGLSWEGGFLIAEEDYVRFLGRMHRGGVLPSRITSEIKRRQSCSGGQREPVHSLLFLGYGMKDWNLRVLLQELGIGTGRAGEEKHYAIMRDPDQIEIELLSKRGITAYDWDLKDFVSRIEPKLSN